MRHNVSTIKTGLEEFEEVRGMHSQKIDTIKNAENIILGEGSSSIPNASAYEMLCGINHVKMANGQIQTFIFPTAPVGMCIAGTGMTPTLIQTSSVRHTNPCYLSRASRSCTRISQAESKVICKRLLLDKSKLDQVFFPFSVDPVTRLKKIVIRGVERACKNGDQEKIRNQAQALGIKESRNLPEEIGEMSLKDERVEELLPKEVRERINTYLLKLPSTIFKTSDGISFVEHMVRQRMKYTLELGDLLLEGRERAKLENLSVESIEEYLGNLTLGKLAELLGENFSKRVAFTYECTECGINTRKKNSPLSPF